MNYMIYEIRGKQVMLDSDLAIFYECKNGAKEINQAVKRNIKRFPEDFGFRMTKEEYDILLKSQSEVSKLNTIAEKQQYPYVFTEEGILMLSTVLRTPKAAEINIEFLNEFALMAQMMGDN